MAKSVYESRFETHLGALRTFALREGHCNVPYAHSEGSIPLGRWVAYVRTRNRRGRLSDAHASALETVPGWSWEQRRPGPQPKTDRNEEIRMLRRSGVSLSVIAETYGLSKQRIHQLCMEKG